MTEAIIPLVDDKKVVSLFGTCDQNIRKLSDAFGVSITHREGKIRISGPSSEVALATKAVEKLKEIVERKGLIAEAELASVLDRAKGNSEKVPEESISGLAAGREVRPRTPGQEDYVKAIREHDVTFAVGPAGTGKTYLAVALAIEALRKKGQKLSGKEFWAF